MVRVDMGYAGTGSAHTGRRRKTDAQRILDGTANAEQRMIHGEQMRDGQQTDQTATVMAPSPHVIAKPRGLNRIEKRIWDELAPFAMAAHTLTPQTAHAFRTLVETCALRQHLKRKIQRDGWVVRRGPLAGKRHPLITTVLQLQQHETSAKLRFNLHPVGREMDFVPPVPAPTADQPIDPWAQFDTPPPLSTPDADDDTIAH